MIIEFFIVNDELHHVSSVNDSLRNHNAIHSSFIENMHADFVG